MFIGAIEQQRALNGFYSNGLFFGPIFLKARHLELKPFIKHHTTKLVIPKVRANLKSRINGEEYLWYPNVIPTPEQMWLSWHTLMSRCARCRKKHLEAKREGRPYRYQLDDSTILRINRNIALHEGSRRYT